jgi:hypothetical protein
MMHLMISRYEHAISSTLSLFADDEIDGGNDHTSVPVVTSITSHSSGGNGNGGSNSTGNPMLDRRRREEMWNDLGLDQLLDPTSSLAQQQLAAASSGTTTAAGVTASSAQRHSNQNQSATSR